MGSAPGAGAGGVGEGCDGRDGDSIDSGVGCVGDVAVERGSECGCGGEVAEDARRRLHGNGGAGSWPHGCVVVMAELLDEETQKTKTHMGVGIGAEMVGQPGDFASREEAREGDAGQGGGRGRGSVRRWRVRLAAAMAASSAMSAADAAAVRAWDRPW